MSKHGHLSSPYMRFLKLVNLNDPDCQKLPNVFFPEDISDPEARAVATKTAKAICKACPMVDECFTYAMETHQRYGIWGATSPQDR
jgi:hypothetical protein